MDLGIKGRTAIVAGGSAGMGKSSAVALAAEGVDLVISARGEARLKAAAEEIASATGVTVVPIVADHSTAEGRARLLTACPEPDILVITCSPPPMVESYLNVGVEDWQSAVATTMIGPIELMRATVGGMADRGFGRVVNIATAAAKSPMMVRLLSGPTRSALVNYTVALSKDFARHNVAINNILPGMFHSTAMGDRLARLSAENGTTLEDEEAKLHKMFRVPAGRFGDCDDLGAFVTMFCSRQANFLIGQSLVIDGGSVHTLF